MDVDQVIGRRVADARKAAGWSQAHLGGQLAEMLGGRWTRQQVSNAETGVRPWAVAEVITLAHLFGVPMLELLRLPAEVGVYTLPGGEVVVGDVIRSASGDRDRAEAFDMLRGLLADGAMITRRTALTVSEVAKALDQARGVIDVLEQAIEREDGTR